MEAKSTDSTPGVTNQQTSNDPQNASLIAATTAQKRTEETKEEYDKLFSLEGQNTLGFETTNPDGSTKSIMVSNTIFTGVDRDAEAARHARETEHRQLAETGRLQSPFLPQLVHKGNLDRTMHRMGNKLYDMNPGNPTDFNPLTIIKLKSFKPLWDKHVAEENLDESAQQLNAVFQKKLRSGLFYDLDDDEEMKEDTSVGQQSETRSDALDKVLSNQQLKDVMQKVVDQLEQEASSMTEASVDLERQNQPEVAGAFTSPQPHRNNDQDMMNLEDDGNSDGGKMTIVGKAETIAVEGGLPAITTTAPPLAVESIRLGNQADAQMEDHSQAQQFNMQTVNAPVQIENEPESGSEHFQHEKSERSDDDDLSLDPDRPMMEQIGEYTMSNFVRQAFNTGFFFVVAQSDPRIQVTQISADLQAGQPEKTTVVVRLKPSTFKYLRLDSDQKWKEGEWLLVYLVDYNLGANTLVSSSHHIMPDKFSKLVRGYFNNAELDPQNKTNLNDLVKLGASIQKTTPAQMQQNGELHVLYQVKSHVAAVYNQLLATQFLRQHFDILKQALILPVSAWRIYQDMAKVTFRNEAAIVKQMCDGTNFEVHYKHMSHVEAEVRRFKQQLFSCVSLANDLMEKVNGPGCLYKQDYLSAFNEVRLGLARDKRTNLVQLLKIMSAEKKEGHTKNDALRLLQRLSKTNSAAGPNTYGKTVNANCLPSMSELRMKQMVQNSCYPLQKRQADRFVSSGNEKVCDFVRARSHGNPLTGEVIQTVFNEKQQQFLSFVSPVVCYNRSELATQEQWVTAKAAILKSIQIDLASTVNSIFADQLCSELRTTEDIYEFDDQKFQGNIAGSFVQKMQSSFVLKSFDRTKDYYNPEKMILKLAVDFAKNMQPEVGLILHNYFFTGIKTPFTVTQNQSNQLDRIIASSRKGLYKTMQQPERVQASVINTSNSSLTLDVDQVLGYFKSFLYHQHGLVRSFLLYNQSRYNLLALIPGKRSYSLSTMLTQATVRSYQFRNTEKAKNYYHLPNLKTVQPHIAQNDFKWVIYQAIRTCFDYFPETFSSTTFGDEFSVQVFEFNNTRLKNEMEKLVPSVCIDHFKISETMRQQTKDEPKELQDIVTLFYHKASKMEVPSVTKSSRLDAYIKGMYNLYLDACNQAGLAFPSSLSEHSRNLLTQLRLELTLYLVATSIAINYWIKVSIKPGYENAATLLKLILKSQLLSALFESHDFWSPLLTDINKTIRASCKTSDLHARFEEFQKAAEAHNNDSSKLFIDVSAIKPGTAVEKGTTALLQSKVAILWPVYEALTLIFDDSNIVHQQGPEQIETVTKFVNRHLEQPQVDVQSDPDNPLYLEPGITKELQRKNCLGLAIDQENIVTSTVKIVMRTEAQPVRPLGLEFAIDEDQDMHSQEVTSQLDASGQKITRNYTQTVIKNSSVRKVQPAAPVVAAQDGSNLQQEEEPTFVRAANTLEEFKGDLPVDYIHKGSDPNAYVKTTHLQSSASSTLNTSFTIASTPITRRRYLQVTGKTRNQKTAQVIDVFDHCYLLSYQETRLLDLKRFDLNNGVLQSWHTLNAGSIYVEEARRTPEWYQSTFKALLQEAAELPLKPLTKKQAASLAQDQLYQNQLDYIQFHMVYSYRITNFGDVLALLRDKYDLEAFSDLLQNAMYQQAAKYEDDGLGQVQFFDLDSFEMQSFCASLLWTLFVQNDAYRTVLSQSLKHVLLAEVPAKQWLQEMNYMTTSRVPQPPVYPLPVRVHFVRKQAFNTSMNLAWGVVQDEFKVSDRELQHYRSSIDTYYSETSPQSNGEDNESDSLIEGSEPSEDSEEATNRIEQRREMPVKFDELSEGVLAADQVELLAKESAKKLRRVSKVAEEETKEGPSSVDPKKNQPQQPRKKQEASEQQHSLERPKQMQATLQSNQQKGIKKN